MNTTKRAQSRSFLIRTILLLAALAAPYPVAAQTVSGSIAAKPGQTVQKPQDQSQIRVRVDLVDTPVVVKDAKGELVLDLTEKNFRILDGDKVQKIEGFDMGGAPLSVAIVVETSSRIEALLPSIRQTGVLFTQKVLGESDDAAVIGYNDQVDRLLDFTGNHDAIDKTVRNLQMGTSGAHLYDALFQAVALLRSRPATRRRAIIAMGEATDTGSEQNLGRVLREAQLANVIIYSIGLSSTAAALRNPPKLAAVPSATPPGTFSLPPMSGTPQTPTTDQLRAGNADLGAPTLWLVKHATESPRDHPLEITAAATGGLFQSTFRDSSIDLAIDQIGGELHAQYLLSYRPPGTDVGGYHKIKVELVDRRGLKVRFRPGYYRQG
jgi:VWFA-related protein